MKEVKIRVTDKEAVTPSEMCRVMEETKDKDLELVRSVYPYKMPSNYISWRLLSTIIALGIVGNRNRNVHAKRDFASFLHSHKCSLWFTQHAPIYCLKESILNSIINTDIENSAEVLRDLQPTIPSFILLFPKGKLLSSDNSPVTFCIIHLSDKNHPEYSQGNAYGIEVPYLQHEHDINVHWSTVDEEGTVWFSGAGLYPDGKVEVSENSVGLHKVNARDKDFLAQMRSIVLQVFLLLQYEPESLGDVQAAETPAPKVRGFQRPKTTEKFLYPRWIDEPVRKAPRNYSQTTKNHASPVTHWRRGHWKTVACGEGRADRKWVRIAPTLVNP